MSQAVGCWIVHIKHGKKKQVKLNLVTSVDWVGDFHDFVRWKLPSAVCQCIEEISLIFFLCKWNWKGLDSEASPSSSSSLNSVLPAHFRFFIFVLSFLLIKMTELTGFIKFHTFVTCRGLIIIAL
ncbi:hypothetical protein Ancab_025714 [Ancistrocladus abbreviatus]